MAMRLRSPDWKLRALGSAVGNSAIWRPVAAIGTLVGGAAALLAWLWPDRMQESTDPSPPVRESPAENAEQVDLPAERDEPGSMARRSDGVRPEVDAGLRRQIGANLDRVQQRFGEGMRTAPEFIDGIAGLQPGEAARWRVNLQANRRYRIIGACDHDCSNIDIELLDASGRVVAADALPDNYPLVAYAPGVSGIHEIKLVLQGCRLAPCYAGARILSTE